MMITSRIISTTTTVLRQNNNNNRFIRKRNAVGSTTTLTNSNSNGINNHNAFSISPRRYFFSKRKRSGRSKGSLRSRIERKLLEKELASENTTTTTTTKLSSYATNKNPHPLKPRSEIMRYIDPWYDLATLCSKKNQEDLLIDKVDSATRIYGVVAALMCSLSAALLAVDFPSIYNASDDDNYNNGDYDNNDCANDNEDVNWKVSGHAGNYNQNRRHHHQQQLRNHQQHSYSNNALQVPTVGQNPGGSTLQRKQTFIEHVIHDYYNNCSTGTSLLVSW